MSWLPSNDPACTRAPAPAIDLVIEARARALPSLEVRRTLPTRERRHVGPFVFLDQMGPVTFDEGRGLDVPPHPHIGLATVTFLTEGELLHRDSLDTAQVIRPGDVNWMSAGRGIVHSERTPADSRRAGARLAGIQAWVALPLATEESEPTFQHASARSIPTIERDDVVLHVIAGEAYGETSPVVVDSSLFYVHGELSRGAVLRLPDEHRERAAHVVEGRVSCEGRTFEAGTMIVFRASVPAAIHAEEPSRVMLLGGAPLDAERHIYWNFVSSSRERIERAKQDWRERRFPLVPGDELDFVPLP